MPSSPPPNPLLVIIGPSASGKTSLAQRLESDGTIVVHPTFTTRRRRADEVGEVTGHRFVDDATFDRMVDAGRFLDVVQPFGLDARYGLPAIERSAAPTRDAVLLRAPFVERLRAHVPDLFVVQIEAPRRVVAARMAARGLSPVEAAARCLHDEAEVEAGRDLADAIIRNTAPIDLGAGAVRGLLRLVDHEWAA